MMKDKLGRKLEKYDLILCIPIYSRMKDMKYAIVIDDNYCYLDSDFGLIKQKVVYKITPNEEEELYRQKLIKTYESDVYALNNGKMEIELEPGGIYSGNTAKVYYVYLGELIIDFKLISSGYNIDNDLKILRNLYSKPNKWFIKINTSTATGRDYYNKIINNEYKTLSELLQSDYFYTKNGFSLLTSLKRNQFKRKIGTFDVDFFKSKRKTYKFNYKSPYSYYAYDIDFIFNKVK